VSRDCVIADLFATAADLRTILDRFPAQRVAVVGDFFLDKYLVIDAALEEPSLETGLSAHQVTEIRNSPGAAGTVVNNLVALDAGNVAAFGVIGDDGCGYELRAALMQMGVDVSSLVSDARIFTPSYMKPTRRDQNGDETELSRLDVLNRRPVAGLGAKVAAALAERIADFDAVIVVDQVADSQGGIVDADFRARLAELGQNHPDVFLLADSRFSIGDFNNVRLKPNIHEARRALGSDSEDPSHLASALASRARRDVFLTCGAEGIVVATPDGTASLIRGVPVSGPTDPTGAGDSASAGITLASAAGADPLQAAAIGCLVASITVQQLRTTGTASRQQVVERFTQLRSNPCAPRPISSPPLPRLHVPVSPPSSTHSRTEGNMNYAALIDQYEQGADELTRSLEGLTRDDLFAHPAAGWSIQEIVIHMMDSDLIGADRMKRTIAEERPSLLGYDETAFAKHLHYELQDARAAAAVFAANRKLFAVVLRALPPETFDRFGMHSERGRETLGELLEGYVQHLEHHLDFLRKKRALLGKPL